MARALEARIVVGALKAAAETTRLRILALLGAGELNVSDLAGILGQSQPRISRHLKLLADAGLVTRFRDGSWVYFQLVEEGPAAAMVRAAVDALDPADPVLVRDRERAAAAKRAREAAAQAYFEAHAAEWNRIRALHVEETEVEAAMATVLGEGPFEFLVDLGTGTGRILELFAARCRRGLGIDLNHSMLAMARARLEKAGVANCQVRHGDLYDLGLATGAADAIVMHQVLHFLADPSHAVREAARVLAPGGRLVVVDFAPHGLEFLRQRHAHERLGFATHQIAEWMSEAGLEVASRDELAPTSADGLTVTVVAGRRAGAGTGSTRRTVRELQT